MILNFVYNSLFCGLKLSNTIGAFVQSISPFQVVPIIYIGLVELWAQAATKVIL